MFNYMQQINKIIQPFPNNLSFWESSSCPDMPEQTQKILHDLIKASMDIWLHAKNERYTSNSFWEIKV